MTKNLRIAVFQYDVTWENPQENINQIEIMLQSIENVDVVVVPEAFNTGFSMNAECVSERIDGFSLNEIRRLTVKYHVALCGSLFLKENSTFFNCFFWIEPLGNEYFYNKRHLFSMGEEHLYYAKGQKAVLIEYQGWKIFPSVCYDIRFPVWLRNISNYDLLLNVANWPAARTEVWETLIRARAIENQCYAVGCNRVGIDGVNVSYSGRSLIVNAKGQVVTHLDQQVSVLQFELIFEELQQFRAKFNTLKDRDCFDLCD